MNGQQTLEKVLNIISHQRNANQTTMRHHCSLTRVAKFKRYGNAKYWQVRELFLSAGGILNGNAPRKTGSFL